MKIYKLPKEAHWYRRDDDQDKILGTQKTLVDQSDAIKQQYRTEGKSTGRFREEKRKDARIKAEIERHLVTVMTAQSKTSDTPAAEGPREASSSKVSEASCTCSLGFPPDSCFLYCQLYPNVFNMSSISLGSWCPAQDCVWVHQLQQKKSSLEVLILSDNDEGLVTGNRHPRLQCLNVEEYFSLSQYPQRARMAALVHEFILKLSTLLHCRPLDVFSSLWSRMDYYCDHFPSSRLVKRRKGERHGLPLLEHNSKVPSLCVLPAHWSELSHMVRHLATILSLFWVACVQCCEKRRVSIGGHRSVFAITAIRNP